MMCSSLANDNDETLRWFGGDGDANSLYPESCRHTEDNGLNGGNCFVTRGEWTRWDTTGLWGEPLGVPISRCFACAGRIAASLPTPSVVNAALQLSIWDRDSNATTASFARAMAGFTFDDMPTDWPDSILPQSQLIARVNNWLGGSLRPSLVYRATSPASDPLFYLHATFVDKLMDEWLLRHGPAMTSSTYTAEARSFASHSLRYNVRNSEGANMCGAPFLPLRSNADYFTLAASSLGYTYA